MSKKHSVPFLCMKCGHLQFEEWESIADAGRKPGRCKKCGRDTRAVSIGTMVVIFQTIIREQERLRSQIFDLECMEEERAEPGVRTA